MKMKILPPKFVKAANMYVVVIIEEDGKDEKFKQEWFGEKEEADQKYKKLKEKKC